MSEKTIGIVGAGHVGGNLGIRLASVGYEVRFGARDTSKLDELVAKCGGRARAVGLEEAGRADVIFVAVPSAAVVDAVRSLGDVSGRVIVDCTNPVGPGPSLAAPPEGSNAARIAGAAPGAKVVKAFNVFGAEFHLDPAIAGTNVDVPIAGDEDGKRVVAAIAEKAGFRTLDLGPLSNAGLLEAMAVMWIHLAMKGGHGRHVAWKLLSR